MSLPIHRRSLEGCDNGAAAVEFALVVPLLVALLLGITTAGVAYSRSVSLTDAVRAGARFGSTALNSGSWASAVQNYTVSASADGLSADQVCVQLVSGTGAVLQSACGLTAQAPANPVGIDSSDCLVKVWAERPVQFNALFINDEVTLHASSVVRYERTC